MNKNKRAYVLHLLRLLQKDKTAMKCVVLNSHLVHSMPQVLAAPTSPAYFSGKLNFKSSWRQD